MTYQIDNIDKRILFELEKNARIPDVKLARIVGKSKDAVRYRINQLEKAGIIEEWKTWIDMAKLGYKTATFYLNIINLPDKKERLIREIKNDRRTYWIGVAEGAWNIGVSYFIKSNNELFDMKNDLLSRYSDLIIDIKISSLVSVSVHEKTFLSSQKSSLITFTENLDDIELDSISKKILAEIYYNSRENIAAIADKLNSTVDIVRNRIKRMEEQKIIIRYTIHINYNKIGYEFYKAFIYLKSFDKSAIESMMRYGEQSSKVINIVKQIASWDIEFIVFATSFADYSNALSDFTMKFAKSIKKVETATMSEDIIFPCRKLPL